MQDRRFTLWAHRGASAVAPENTMAAFEAALAAGADGIELDVHLSRDGAPVVMHDADVRRTTDGRGAVSGMLLRDLKRLDAGSWFGPSFSGERVPTLAEVLEWAQGRLALNVEIKSAGCAEAVVKLLGTFRSPSVLVSSFHLNLLRDLRRHAPKLPLGVVIDSRFWGRAVKKGVLFDIGSVHPRWDIVTPRMVGTIRSLGLKVYPWTVDDPGALTALHRLGVDGVFTNDPDLVAQVLKNTGQIGHGGL